MYLFYTTINVTCYQTLLHINPPLIIKLQMQYLCNTIDIFYKKRDTCYFQNVTAMETTNKLSIKKKYRIKHLSHRLSCKWY